MTDRPASTRISARDLLGESLAGITTRPLRSLGTMVGSTLGVALLIVTVGLASAAGNQILTTIDDTTATLVVVRDPSANTTSVMSPGAAAGPVIPADAIGRALSLRGVRAAATLTELPRATPVSSVSQPDVGAANETTVYAATPGLLVALGAEVETGRSFDQGHNDRHDRVAIVGSQAARALGIDRVGQQPYVTLASATVAVIGILAPLPSEPDLDRAVIVPEGFGRRYEGLARIGSVVLRTRLGFGPLVGRQIAVALSPNDPGQLDIEAPPDPRAMQRSVRSDLNRLLEVLAGASMLIGAVGIGNTTLVGVLERRGEIGLRRAVGAPAQAILLQFLLEGGLLGLVGGVIGSAGGIVATTIVCGVRGWVPVLDARLILMAPIASLLVGLAAAAHPAARAAAVSPVDALKG